MTIRFDDAWDGALQVAADAASNTHRDVILVRDLLGRVSLVVEDLAETGTAGNDSAAGWVDDLAARLATAAGPFIGPTPVTLASGLFSPDLVLRSPDIITVAEATSGRGRVRVLERGVVGAEWLHTRSPGDDGSAIHRVALYGFKGGVGRSTATFMLATEVAARDRVALVVDLDLESPGVGALLQGDDDLPDYGLVDYLAESAVRNEGGLELVVRGGLAPVSGNGEVWVAAPSGRPRAGYDYLAKLNRAYLDLPGGDHRSGGGGLAGRIEAAIGYCEDEVEAKTGRRPDVVLLDSRAGVHDIAAVVITKLADLSLLFALDSAQTWNGYRLLFQQWSRVPEQAREVRNRLQMVASMVPRADREAYLERFRDHAQSCFAETLYDDVQAAEEVADDDQYNPAPDDELAPHFPWPILHVPEYVGLDLSARPGWHDIDRPAYETFLNNAASMILGEERGPA
jgi:hypothetical protein